MSTTTQILFNSPALHSLKRDQLVKLCKIHSIKASGKNVELIEKLKQHAQTLPRDSPLSVAARSEGLPPAGVEDEKMAEETATEDIGSHRHFQMPRPSEQWEVVMESIEEMMEDSSSQGTLSSTRTLNNVNGMSGEFGTGTSKCMFSLFISLPLMNPQPSLQRRLVYQSFSVFLGAEAAQYIQICTIFLSCIFIL